MQWCPPRSLARAMALSLPLSLSPTFLCGSDGACSFAPSLLSHARWMVVLLWFLRRRSGMAARDGLIVKLAISKNTLPPIATKWIRPSWMYVRVVTRSRPTHQNDDAEMPTESC